MPTADDYSARWLLLSEALALVTERCKSQAAAKELLPQLLQDGRIHWAYWQKAGYWPMSVVRRLVRDEDETPGTPDWRFWHSDGERTHLTIDWENSSATRTGPVPHSPEWPPLAGPEPPENFKVSLIRLRHADVLEGLRYVYGGDLPDRSPTTPVVPKVWLVQAVKDHKKRRDETRPGYAKRLAGLMLAAKANGEVTKTWTNTTIVRRWKEAEHDKGATPSGKNRAGSGKPRK